MKHITFLIIIILSVLSGCNSLDLNPLSEGSSETWYSNETEIKMSIYDLYRINWWYIDDDSYTDDWTARNTVSAVAGGTVNSEWSTAAQLWQNSYTAIARANTVLTGIEGLKDQIPQKKLEEYSAEARFVRASMYSQLISHFGDVVYYTNYLDLDEAFRMGRTSKDTVLQHIYEDFDYAIDHLPESYGSGEIKRATKGAALGLKARIALYNSDWSIARKAAHDCMELGYSLYPNFRDLFLTKTKDDNEVIFSIPRSVQLGVSLSVYYIRRTITRNAGGWAAQNPSWDLLASFLCTDGLPIDESPLFNPREPFENRDPRCGMTIVPFQTEFLGFMYQPHPDSTEVLNFNTGQYQYNNDTRSNKQYASYNGLVWKKWVDKDWSDDRQADPDKFIIRYADILLMYAEASIELNQIDQSVLDAMNMVRARAYGVTYDQTGSYPAITTMDQNELRKILRMERRMEFAFEGLRYMDLIRWKLANKALTTTIYGMLDPADLKANVVDKGLWFWAQVPSIDNDGIADFTSMYDGGYCKTLAIRAFDPSKQYLWPIPSKEILINENMKQNPGY